MTTKENIVTWRRMDLATVIAAISSVMHNSNPSMTDSLPRHTSITSCREITCTSHIRPLLTK